ncbi:MAG: START domain-containing protein [Bacteroidota bacterium]
MDGKHVEEYPEWVPNCKKAFIIEQIDTYNVYYYAASTFPWPLQNRDLVAHSVFDQDPITKEITILTEAVEGHHPAQKGLIRIEVLQAIWILTPKPDGVVTITYFLKTDPAGNIPAWMTNKFMDRGPIQTMEKLRDMAKLEKYKNVKMSIIEEAESPSR